MRNVFATSFLLFAIATAVPELITGFIEPLPETFAQTNATLEGGVELELVKRQQQSGCASGYAACAQLDPGLCCRNTEVCARDGANNVACCPMNARCTGTIIPNPAQTVSLSSLPSSNIASPTTTSPTQTGSFVQSGTGSRSMVPNQYYPFAFIPTTYTNAAACSSAYTSCQTEAASCTSALANGLPGVTISGPNGGATITAIASLGQVSASQICSSLSATACSGLAVAACSAFGSGNGGAAMTRCGNMYGVGAGVALGIAGQLLR
jgi:hypothetical protein